MAQPRDYTRQYNFTDYQSSAPSDPLPANEVDNELNAVKLTLDDLNDNIGLIQRDDGRLANAAVHKDAFDAGALALMNADSFAPRGDWVSLTAYAVNDLVDFNGATYLATSAHTSSAAFTTDLAADRWVLLANAAIATTAASVDKFEGDGVTTVYTLAYSYAANTSALVFVNGSLRNPGDDYTIVGNQLTFGVAPSVPSVAGNENVIVWGASVVAQAAKEAAEAAEANASGFADEAEAWASQTTGIVESTDYSSKAYAVGGTGVDTGAGSAKDWAIKTSGTVGGTTDYSAKYWATSPDVVTVSSNIGDITTVSGSISDVGVVATNIADVQSVALNMADVLTADTNAAAALASATAAAASQVAAAASATSSASSASSSASSTSLAAGSEANAASSASSASGSAANAATSATQSANSASSSSTSASLSAASASNAATSEANASASEVSAASSAAAAALSAATAGNAPIIYAIALG